MSTRIQEDYRTVQEEIQKEKRLIEDIMKLSFKSEEKRGDSK